MRALLIDDCFEPSDARGVGSKDRFAAAGRPFLGLSTSKSPRFSASFARGVGHIATKRFSETDFIVSKFRVSEDVDLRTIWSDAVGVGIECVGFATMPSASALLGSGARKFCGDLPPERIAVALVFDASGVGNNPEPVAPVRGANGGSGYAVPPRIVPERGQVSENVSKSSTKERCDVFHDDVAGS
jgi:hypothetical protein